MARPVMDIGPQDAVRAVVRAPMVRVAIPFMAGIALGAWRDPPRLAVLAALASITPACMLVLLFPTTRLRRWQRGAVLNLWFLCFGLFWQLVRDPRARPDHIGRWAGAEGIWLLAVDAVNASSGRVFRADARVLGVRETGAFEGRSGRVMLTLMRDAASTGPRKGDRIVAEGVIRAIDRIPNPGGFDRRAWAASRGIAHELFVPAGDWARVGHRAGWTGLFDDAREGIAAWLSRSALGTRERALVKALVLGQRDELDSEQRSAFARSGTIHVLAVSGMHVGLIFAILSFLTAWTGAGLGARLLRGLLILAALWGYAGLTGATPSVLRATFMFTLFTLANMALQRTDHLNSLFAAAFVLLLWDPAMLGQAGFQLSFLAVLGIIVFYRPIERLWQPASRFARAIWSLAVVSVSAQLLTAPLSMLLFKAFPVWFLPANIVVVAAVGLAVNLSVALLLLQVVPVVGEALAVALAWLLQGVEWFTTAVGSLPGAYPTVRIGPGTMVLLYLLMAALAAWWQWRRRGMRTASAMLLAVLLAGWALRAREARQRTGFTVYDLRGGTMMAMTQGRTLVMAGDSLAMATDPHLRSVRDRHAAAWGIENILLAGSGSLHGAEVLERGGTLIGGGRWRSPALDVLVVDGTRRPPELDRPRRFDVVVVHGVQWLDAAAADRLRAMTSHLVLAGDLPWRVRRVLMHAGDAHPVIVHDVRARGAFVLQR